MTRSSVRDGDGSDERSPGPPLTVPRAEDMRRVLGDPRSHLQVECLTDLQLVSRIIGLDQPVP